MGGSQNFLGVLGEFFENFWFWGNFLKKISGNSFGILWEFFGNSLGVLWEFFGSSLKIQFLSINYTNLGYGKILGLRRDRTRTKTITRSAS